MSDELDSQDDSDSYLPSHERAVPDPNGEGILPGLSYLRWGQHKGSGTVAIMLLFALVIRSNLDQKISGIRKNNRVVATYDQLEELTLLSREMSDSTEHADMP